MKKIIFFIILVFLICLIKIIFFSPSSDVVKEVSNNEGVSIDKKISQMLVLGYSDEDSFLRVLNYAREGNISGVIFYARNIKSRSSISSLISLLNSGAGKVPLFIMLDQEGGRVSRISDKNGFKFYPSAEKVSSSLSEKEAYELYFDMAKSLKSVGFNFNLAPCVDLKISEKSFIGGNNRTYGNNPSKVSNYAISFIKAHNDNNVITTLKHFPGLGNAVDDTHKGLPDITNTWTQKEIMPYSKILHEFPVEPVMIGHVYNRKIDADNVASISVKTIDILKKDLGHSGLVIMDAPDMSALEDFSIEKIIISAINAGVDIFIFPNHQYSANDARLFMTPHVFHNIVKKALQNGEITEEQLDCSYNKIINIKRKYLLK